MQFDSLGAFLAMGGYGFYVWLSFGITAIMMVLITFQTRMEYRTLLGQIGTEKRRKARIQKARTRQHDTQTP